MKSIIKIYLLGLCLLSISCEKESSGMIDLESPGISIFEPSESVVYQSNSNLPVKAQIIENDQLHEVRVEIYQLRDSSLVFSTHTHQHTQNVIYETSMFLPLTDSVELYEVKLIASDHSGNTGEKSVQVRVTN